MTESAPDEGNDSLPSPLSIPEFVDWIAGLLIAVAGIALVVGGSTLSFVVDRSLVAESIDSGQITVIVFERDLTEPEMLEVTMAVVTWTGWGLLVAGLGLLLFAIGYVVSRHRAYQRTPASESPHSSLSSAVLGAVATGLLSFLPFAPVIGGGLAGYLERHGTGRTVSVGALSGFLTVAPLLLILVFVTIGLYAGLATIQYGGLGIVTAVAMLFAWLFTAAYGAGLGAIGGFAGGRFGS